MKKILAASLVLLASMATAQEVNDQALVDRVHGAITSSEIMNGSDILAVSVNGYVLLAGQVLNSEQKQEASIRAAFASNDIRRLINELEVVEKLDYSYYGDDRKILDQIEVVIPEMSPATVPIIHNGVVYLLGQVSREEGNAVAQEISRMAGVKSIRMNYEFVQ